jgi:DNA-binding IclR family transcriptional regulator
VKKLDDPTLTDIANHLDYPKSTTHNHLKTLTENGYLKVEDGVYELTLFFLDLGIYAKQQLRIARLSKEILQQLAEDTNEAAWLMVEEQGYVVGVEKALGERAVQTSGRIGRHTRFHYHAPGKAILANLDDDRVDEILAQQGLPGKTEHTITDRDRLFEEIEEVREQGYAVDDEERIHGVRCVAAPINDDGGDVIGAVSVSGPKSGMRGKRFNEEIPEMVLRTANVIQVNLKYQ